MRKPVRGTVTRGIAASAAALLVTGVFAPSATQADDPGVAPEDRPSFGEKSPSEELPPIAAGVIVKYRPGTATAQMRETVARLAEAPVTVTSVAPRVRAFVTDTVPLVEAEALAAKLEKRSDVEWAEPNGIRYTADSPWPVPVNDPYAVALRNVWDMQGPESAYVSGLGVTPWPAGGYGTKSPALWPATTGRGVVVAVLDTGITSHPDLAPNVLAGYDMISAGPSGSLVSANDGDGRDPDASDPGSWTTEGLCRPETRAAASSWHGTHVAGTVGAVVNNGQGVVGVAPGTRIQPVRVLGRCGGSDADITAAIMWAAGVAVPGVPANPTPAKVINLSLGGAGTCSQAWVDAINAARGAGASVVVALGNDNQPAGGYVPASCPGVIGVHSTSDYGDHASYSNFGPEADVSAPGGDSAWGENNGIYSTVDNGTTVPTGPGYGWKDGTSMAAPAAAAVAALIASVGNFTPDQLEAALKASVIGFPTASNGGFVPCNTSQCGSGILDASKVPAPVTGPSVSGVPAVGQALAAAGGAWHGPAVAHAFTWFANGQVVGSGPTYVVSSTDVGKTIVVRESVASGVYAPIGADSAGVAVPAVVALPPPPAVKAKKKAKLKVTLAKKRVRGHIKLIVKVKVKGVKKPKGKIKIKLTNKGKGKLKKNLKKKLKKKSKGTVTFVLPRLKRGQYKVKITYSGTKAISRAKRTYTLRAR